MCAQVQQLYEAGNYEQARSLYLILVPVNAAVTSMHGIPGLKYAATLLGYDGGCVRSPLATLHEAGQEQIRQLLSDAGLL